MKKELVEMFLSDKKKLASVAMAVGYTMSDDPMEASMIMMKIMEGFLSAMTEKQPLSTMDDDARLKFVDKVATAVAQTAQDELKSKRVYKELKSMSGKSSGKSTEKNSIFKGSGPKTIAKPPRNKEFERQMDIIMEYNAKHKKKKFKFNEDEDDKNEDGIFSS